MRQVNSTVSGILSAIFAIVSSSLKLNDRQIGTAWNKINTGQILYPSVTVCFIQRPVRERGQNPFTVDNFDPLPRPLAVEEILRFYDFADENST